MSREKQSVKKTFGTLGGGGGEGYKRARKRRQRDGAIPLGIIGIYRSSNFRRNSKTNTRKNTG